MNHVVHEAHVYLCGYWGTYFHRHVTATPGHESGAACPAQSWDVQGSIPSQSEPCTPPDMAWLCLSQAGHCEDPQQRVDGFWVQPWGVPELGLHHLGRYFAPRTFSWEKEEERRRRDSEP